MLPDELRPFSLFDFIIASMPAPEKVASHVSLKERLARLKLQGEAGVTPTSDPSPPSPSNASSSVRTGAVTKVSDKISRFQANAETAPLLPEGGSFGLAPARARAPGSKDRGVEKGRVASLGGGRAPVPLHAVAPRSVSTGGSPSTRSEAGSSGESRSGSRVASRESSAGAEEQRPTTPGGEPTPVPSPTASSSSVVEQPGEEVPSLSLPPAPSTPGALSVSSMRVETGSLTDEGAAPNPADIDISAANLAGETHSPLSSPVVAAIAYPPPSSASVSSADGIAPSIPTSASKGLLDSLRAPSRAGSIASLSSMIVEAPSEDVANLSEISRAATPTAEPPGLVKAAEDERSRSASPGGEAASEEQRSARTDAELALYEEDEADPAAPAQGAESAGPGSNGDLSGARDAMAVSVSDASHGSPEDVTSATAMAEDEGADSMPKVKCSDCSAELDLMQLADHSCASSSLPPYLTSPPASPQSVRQASTRSIPDVPTSESPPASPRNSFASPSRAHADQEPSHSQDVDRYASLPEGLVPEDMPQDVIDLYGDEGSSRSVPAPMEQAVPEDVEVDHHSPIDPPPVSIQSPTAISSSSSSSTMTRSSSTPSTAPGAASQLRAQKKAAEPRSQSVYGGPMPGKYYSSDDEDGAEAGSVTIIRSTRGK
ncbi:hypothetical protein JCM11641_005469 [Rhodosporidiobolus odoratus]